MILLHPIVQVLVLADLDGVTGVLLKCLDRRGIGPAFVDRDLVRETVLAHSLLEKAPRGLLVTMGGEQKVNGLAVPIDGTVKILPLAFDLDVRFVHPPTVAYRALLPFPESRFQLRSELLDPAVDVRMIDLDATLRHHFF